MHYHGKTITYFFTNGLKYGALCGLLFGTLAFPIGGQVVAAPIGLLVGLILGVLVGMGVAFYNATRLNADYLTYAADIVLYRRTLMRTIGLGTFGLVVLGAAAWFPFKPEFVAWGEWIQYQLPALLVVTGVVGVPAGLMAGAFAAYATSEYADWYASLIIKNKRYEEDIEPQVANTPEAVFEFWFAHLFANERWAIGLLSVLVGGASFVLTLQQATSNTFATAFGMSIFYVFGFIFFALSRQFLVALGNSFLVLGMNRLYFDEYQPDMHPTTYKNRLTLISFWATLIYGCVISGLVFAPVSAFFAAWTARQYADYRYRLPEKAKRSTDEYLHLQVDDAPLEMHDDLVSLEPQEMEQR